MSEISSLTQKFINCVSELKARGVIKMDIEVANAINYPKTNLSAVLKGKFNIPYKHAFNFATHYQLADFFSAELNKEIKMASPEPLSLRPYNLPVVQTESQGEYLRNYDDVRIIEKFHRRPILSVADSRGAEWRWFEAGGLLKSKVYDENDLLLCRMIHSEDWQLQQVGREYIILTKKQLLLKKIVDKSAHNLCVGDLDKESNLKLSLRSIHELWIVRYSLLKETTKFYENRK
jgi:hypothetical protein